MHAPYAVRQLAGVDRGWWTGVATKDGETRRSGREKNQGDLAERDDARRGKREREDARKRVVAYNTGDVRG